VSYAVKEIFYTLQGEGANAGRPAVFCRFTGCNLWSGREKHRAKAVCRFCDTDFVGTDGPGGGRFADAATLAARIAALWPRQGVPRARALVVFTGGEPLLQLDEALIHAVHARGMEIAVETNGTQPAPAGIDWLCVSPKAGAPLALRSGDELKLVYPQADAPPERFAGLGFHDFYLQPMDGPDYARNLAATVDYCLRHPQWRLSLQLHKLVGIA
jgi:7-carboxy-7-deazaguanine synthase (Cx14CxxC type)